MGRVLLISLGGALGTAARYGLSTWVAHAFGPDFPRGTLLINVSGSFLIAVIMELSAATGAIPQNARLFLATGVMGGYTTYSSFNYETLKLASEGTYELALLYVALTVLGALGGGFLGILAARSVGRLGLWLVR